MFLALALACALALAPGEARAQTWIRVEGETGVERAAAVRVLAGGSAAWAGVTTSAGAGGLDALVQQVDRCGRPSWTRTLGTPLDERAAALAVPVSGVGLLVAGDRETAASDLDGWWARLDAAGSIVWQAALGGAGDDAIRAAAATTDGGFLLAGSLDGEGTGGSDGWIVRLDGAGAVVWQQRYGGTGDDRLRAIAERPGGGAWAVGERDLGDPAYDELWLLRLDPAGSVLWERTLGGEGDESGRALVPTADGGVVVAGFSDSTGLGLSDAVAARWDAAGGLGWQRALGGSDDDIGLAAAALTGSVFALAGESRTLDPGAGDAWAAGLASGGGVLWARSYGGTAGDTAAAVARGAGSGLVLAGSTRSIGQGQEDAWLVRTDGAGDVLAGCALTSQVTLTEQTAGLAVGTTASVHAAVTLVPSSPGLGSRPVSVTADEPCPATPGEVSPPGAEVPLAFVSATGLAWEPAAAACASAFDLYRGELAATGGSGLAACLTSGLTDPGATDADEPAPGDAFFYLVSGTGAGMAGPLGFDSAGAPRLPAAACP